MNTNKERTQEQWLREEAYERRKRQREREQNDPEYAEYLAKQRAYQKAWRERHPYYGQQWRDKNPHYQDPYNKRARERMTGEDKLRMSEYQRQWRAAHPDYFKNWRKRKIEETRRKMKETKDEKRERIRKSLPVEARKALVALEQLKNKKKKEQRQE